MQMRMGIGHVDLRVGSIDHLPYAFLALLPKQLVTKNRFVHHRSTPCLRETAQQRSRKRRDGTSPILCAMSAP